MTLSDLLHINLRTVNREDTGFFDRFHVNFRKQYIQSVLVQALYAEALVKDRARHFAFTEARYVNLSDYFLECFIQSCVDAVRCDFDGKNPLVLL
ncbi:hypothetical protein D3C71_1939150 [compost metagenome]